MLLSDTLHPTRMVYYQGAKVLQTLQQEGGMLVGGLYVRMNEKIGMSYPVLMLCLDWLYLIDVIVINEKGEVSLCI